MAMHIAIIGGLGRMGQALAAAAQHDGITVTASLDAGDDLGAGMAKADVIIDFSSHKITADVIRMAVALGKPLVIGTTGHAAEEKNRLRQLAAAVPCVWSGNFSIGVNLLFALTQQAARILKSDYDAEVVEMHHRFKQDAPSGTAARLLESFSKNANSLQPPCATAARASWESVRLPRSASTPCAGVM